MIKRSCLEVSAEKRNARKADKIRLCGHLRRYKKIVKKTYIIYMKSSVKVCEPSALLKLLEEENETE